MSASWTGSVAAYRMSDAFNGYSQEYEQIKQSIQSKLDSQVKRQQGGQSEPPRSHLNLTSLALTPACDHRAEEGYAATDQYGVGGG